MPYAKDKNGKTLFYTKKLHANQIKSEIERMNKKYKQFGFKGIRCSLKPMTDPVKGKGYLIEVHQRKPIKKK